MVRAHCCSLAGGGGRLAVAPIDSRDLHLMYLSCRRTQSGALKACATVAQRSSRAAALCVPRAGRTR